MTDIAPNTSGAIARTSALFDIEPLLDTPEVRAGLRKIDRKSFAGMYDIKLKNELNLDDTLNNPAFYELSFAARQKSSAKLAGYCVAHFNEVSGEPLIRVDLLAALPRSMAGVALMGELLERINEHDIPVEFIALSDTTGKILRRRTAQTTLAANGWDMITKSTPGPIRHEKFPYRAEAIRLQRR